MQSLAGIGGERYWVHIPRRTTKVRAYRNGGLVAAADAVRGSPMANAAGDSELIHVNKYELQQLREMWGEPTINPETGLPAYGVFGFIKKAVKSIVKPVAKIAGTVLLTGTLGPVGAAMAVSGISGAIEGKNLGQIAKGVALTGLTAGAGQIGGKVLPGLIGVDKAVGQAIGAGIGTGAGVAAQGGNLSQSLTAGLASGIGTFTTNKIFDKVVDKNILGLGDAAKAVYGAGQDIANKTGLGTSISGIGATKPSPYQQMLQTKAPASVVESYSPDVTNTLVPVTPSPIVVQAPSVTGGVTYTPEGIVVVGSKPARVPQPTEEQITLSPEVPGWDAVGNRPIEEVVDLYPSVPGGGGDWGGGGGGGSVADNVTIYPGPGGGGYGGGDTPLKPSGGTYDTGPRTDMFGTRGLANITFDPFTYGQVAGNQPGEFLFFTQDGKPYGVVGGYNPPAVEVDPTQMKEGGDVDDDAYDDDDMVKHLVEWNKGGGHAGPGRVKGIGSGQEDKIPAWLSDGEYVWSAQDVADLGDGSTDEGVRRLDQMRQMVRRRAGRKDVKKIAKPQHGIDTMLKAVGGPV